MLAGHHQRAEYAKNWCSMPKARSITTNSAAIIRLIQNNLAHQYRPDAILKELLQNADDARANSFRVGLLPDPIAGVTHELLKGPLLFAVNDAELTEKDALALCEFGINFKSSDPASIGRFGLGLKSVFHLCEAFFFLSSTAFRRDDPDGLYANLANPWGGVADHPDWDEVSREDLDAIRRAVNLPVELAESGHWFCLALPLRLTGHVRTHGFLDDKYGETLDDIRTVVSEEQLTQWCLALPLLQSLRSVEILGGFRLTLPASAGRSRFREWAQAVDAWGGSRRTGRARSFSVVVPSDTSCLNAGMTPFGPPCSLTRSGRSR